MCSALFCSSAYWNATRAFMILSAMSCFAGIIAGILSFAHFSAFERFNRSFAAGIMFFVSSEWRRPWVKLHQVVLRPNLCIMTTNLYWILKCASLSVLSRSSLCFACNGHLHGGDSELSGQALRWLAFLLVIHTRLGGTADDLLCRFVFRKGALNCVFSVTKVWLVFIHLFLWRPLNLHL